MKTAELISCDELIAATRLWLADLQSRLLSLNEQFKAIDRELRIAGAALLYLENAKANPYPDNA
jgi:hypothetical protein